MASQLEIETMLAELLADPARSSLELPNLNKDQRKLVKQVVDRHPQLTCESFGFGADRQLHVFKKAVESSKSADDARKAETPAVNVKNTFIDDWIASPGSEDAPEPVIFRSVPPKLPKVQLSLAERVEDTRGHAPTITAKRPVVMSRLSSPDRSTTASASSPASTAREWQGASSESTMPPPPGVPLPPGLQVRNTFIHVEGARSDARAVQSMPHGMFGQALLEELAERETSAAKVVPPETQAGRVAPTEPCAVDAVLPAGTPVVIENLQKMPAFNGLTGSVQCFEEDTGRYSILLTKPTIGHKFAKVKRENLRTVEPPSPPPYEAGALHFPPTPTWDSCNSGEGKQLLTLTALV